MKVLKNQIEDFSSFIKKIIMCNNKIFKELFYLINYVLCWIEVKGIINKTLKF